MSTDSVSPADPYSPHPRLDQANADVEINEQSVLGSMILNKDARIDVPRILDRDDFYRPKHQAVWDAITALIEQGKPVDELTVGAELDRMGVFERVGGPNYIITMVSTVPTAVNATFYAEEVKKVAIKRTIAEESQRLLQAAQDSVDVDDLEERVAKSYEECMSALSDPDADEARPVGEDDALMDEFVTNLGKRPTSAFSTGIDDLDRAMIARNGALILLSADTGVGKSLLAAQIARHYARDRGERVLFHSLEMSRDEMVERDMSAVSGVALSKITGVHDLEPSNYDLIKDEYLPAYREWASRLHYVEGKASVSEVARNAQRLNHEHRGDSGIGLVVLDYLQIAKRPRDVSTERDDLALAAMTGALKELAMDLGCVVICISQFNNEGAKSSAPQTYHLKGSSSLGQDADVVGMMIDPSKDDESRAGEVEVSLPKVRKGVSGTTVTIAEQRHKAHFRALNDNDRADMSVADRLNAPSPLPT